MSRHPRTRSRKTGLPPGSPVHTGTRLREQTAVTMLQYGADSFTERALPPEDCAAEASRHTGVTWIDVDSVHDIPTLETLGRAFALHPLTIEDIASTEQRPKVEDYGHYIYIVVRMMHGSAAEGLVTEQVSLILGDHFVLSFQEGIRGDVFDPVRTRLRTSKGRIRALGSDYLCYALLDAVIDNYFNVLEDVGDRIEAVEDELVRTTSAETLHALHGLKRELIHMRKSVWPLREVIAWMQRDDTLLITSGTQVFLRDIYDHTIQVIDTIETSRDMLAGMLDVYMSSVSNRMNEIMKVLTIMSTIFIPLTFIAGVYGMNFAHMPELAWPWGYPAVLAFMALLVAGMLRYFRSRRWL